MRKCCEVIAASANYCDVTLCDKSRGLDMGLGAGGLMKQDIYVDPFDLEDWDQEHTSRVFVHIANSLTWKAVTKEDPPYPPLTASDYTKRGFPWFDYYSDNLKALAGTGLLKNIQSVMQLGFQKGLSGILPENTSCEPTCVRTVGSVRDGVW